MRSSRCRPRRRRRKCRHCGELFTPDCRNWRHQRYCCKPACRKASKRAAQKRWLSSEKGAGYFQDSDNAARVQRWRATHPGYWKRDGAKSADALQDHCHSQDVEKKGDTPTLNCTVLQDFLTVQPALLIGLISSLTGSALQDDIAETTRRLVDSGRDIMGFSP